MRRQREGINTFEISLNKHKPIVGFGKRLITWFEQNAGKRIKGASDKGLECDHSWDASEVLILSCESTEPHEETWS